MERLEDEIVFVKLKDMAPFTKSNDTKNHVYTAKDNSQQLIVKHKPKKGLNLIKNSENKIIDCLTLNNLVQESSQALCLHDNISVLSSNASKSDTSNNDFSKVTHLASLLNTLQEIRHCNEMCKSVPNALQQFEHLQTLNLSNSFITEVPDNLCLLKNLESLILSGNQLTDLPLSCEKLQKLKILDISNNNFMQIPQCIENGMSLLKILNVSQNPSMKVNIVPCSKYLEKFYCKENGNCKVFPDWILSKKFFNLKEFYLDYTEFNSFNFIGNNGQLNITTASMTCSKLSSPILENIIENMVKLEIMQVGNENCYNSENIFINIPIHELKNPQLIKELNFRRTNIPSVPNTVNLLCNIESLDIGFNCIQWLPDEICELSNLKNLKLDGNNLIMLPDNIGNLTALEDLRMEKNDLTRLPNSFQNLKKLKFLDLYDNSLNEFPNLLCELTNLQGLDLEQNFFSTDDIKKINDVSYSSLRATIISCTKNYNNIIKSKVTGHKTESLTESYDNESSCSENNSYQFSSEDDDTRNVPDNQNTCDENNCDEENWDTVTDTDDEFDPINEYNKSSATKTKTYSKFTLLKSTGFCPDDLHTGRIKREIAVMRIYGSVPCFKVQEGQFDDA